MKMEITIENSIHSIIVNIFYLVISKKGIFYF